jgi:hypothetical protein
MRMAATGRTSLRSRMGRIIDQAPGILLTNVIQEGRLVGTNQRTGGPDLWRGIQDRFSSLAKQARERAQDQLMNLPEACWRLTRASYPSNSVSSSSRRR